MPFGVGRLWDFFRGRRAEPAVSVAISDLERLLASMFCCQGLSESHSLGIAELLVDTEVRGVKSHGIAQFERYLSSYRRARLNRHPEIEVVRKGEVTASISGDGGLGLTVGREAMELAIEMAQKFGVGVVTSTSHGHLGSTGNFVRMALRRSFLGLCLSGRSAAAQYAPERSILTSTQGTPPFTMGVPSRPGSAPIMLDMACYVPWNPLMFHFYPELYFKFLGLAHLCNLWSGTLGGQMLVRGPGDAKYPDADQSGFFVAVDIERFVDLELFLQDVHHLVDEASRMRPLPGRAFCELPGGPEWRHEQLCRREGIPLKTGQRLLLEKWAEHFHLAVPWKGRLKL